MRGRWGNGRKALVLLLVTLAALALSWFTFGFAGLVITLLCRDDLMRIEPPDILSGPVFASAPATQEPAWPRGQP